MNDKQKYETLNLTKLPEDVVKALNMLKDNSDDFQNLSDIDKGYFDKIFAGIQKDYPEAVKVEKQEVNQDKETTKPDNKIALDYILIHWAEGKSDIADVLENKKFYSWEKANEAVMPVYNDIVNECPNDDCGYNKVKFTVKWKDNEDYKGRLDINQKEDNPAKGNVFGKHIKDTVQWYIDNAEQQKTSNETKQEYIEFLNTYCLDDNCSKSKSKPDLQKDLADLKDLYKLTKNKSLKRDIEDLEMLIGLQNK